MGSVETVVPNRTDSDLALRREAKASRTLLPFSQLLGYITAAVAVVVIFFFSFHASQIREDAARAVRASSEALDRLEDVMSALKDAETGQRGYMLSGKESYLEPYTNASALLPSAIIVLREALASDSDQLQRLEALERKIHEKQDELAETIALKRAGQERQGLAVVLSDRGRLVMDSVRNRLQEIERAERNKLNQRQMEWQNAVDISNRVTLSGSAVILVLIVIAGIAASRDYRARQLRLWMRSAQNAFAERIQGEYRLDSLGNKTLQFLAEFTNARVGAIYIEDHSGCYRRFANYATEPTIATDVMRKGDSLVGQAAQSRQTLHITNVPDGYLDVVSGLGRSKPAQLLVMPAISDASVHAVVELAYLHALSSGEKELIEEIAHAFAVAVRSSRERDRREELLAETQRQAEELQTQQEELRVSNEELEEQGRALKISQAQLESQHAELEQTNAHLEEQTQLLEQQKDDLSRSQTELSTKAAELERSNQYKSEFLANMSHELRTPLNSTLILSKLLADNKDGNLTPEQVKFAQTISSAGNDLLELINDILDLSKIEAGKVEVVPEQISVRKTLDALNNLLKPIAEQKKLSFRLEIAPDTPDSLRTDTQRLHQILRNLLSNAIKFTEKGEVSLKAAPTADGRMMFQVRDTGIGIPEHQHEVIFEAFRQADGSTHRKYGGTGLGLSIARDLARLLGGDITLKSEAGSGSTFILILPLQYSGKAKTTYSPGAPSAPSILPSPRTPPAPAKPKRAEVPFADDRDYLRQDARRILIVEDDTKFAGILHDLAHELGFQVIGAQSGNEAIAAATEYRPHAILLDVHLPDFSGLGVLDRLKHDPLTRHIPVHVVSVEDYSQQALERGAVGYALKPVKREELVEAFHRLESKLAQQQRRVLVIEDDARQRDSIQQLLGNQDTEIIGVETAAAALSELQSNTFDCLVMDLNLPDRSGYELLEDMAAREDLPFPPVIVYTGRLLTEEEEQQLRRFSKSIIIKDARSPERLLDEVTLFLHQVESTLPPAAQNMLKAARNRETLLEGRRILLVEDDVRNIFALSSVLEPKGAKIEIARNGIEALKLLEANTSNGKLPVDLVLMDIMMPEMDGLTAMREIRKRPEWKRLPIIALTAKAMRDDQEECLAAGANDYIAKPLNVEKLLSLVRVWVSK